MCFLRPAIVAILLLAEAGCRTTGKQERHEASDMPNLQATAVEPKPEDYVQQATYLANPAAPPEAGTQNQEVVESTEELLPAEEDETDAELLRLPPSDPTASSVEIAEESPGAMDLELSAVVASVRSHFPLIQQAAAGRAIASGEILSANGAFDRKLEGFTESQPLDYYENYRHEIGLKRDTRWGGHTFAKYRNGRGVFEPWYQERATNKGGEFKAGFMAPVIRDRWIDANRAELWRAQLERRRLEPVVLQQVITSVRDGSVAYWNWVAAGANYRVMQGLLDLAIQRNEGLKVQVELQEKAPIDLVDNQRIIVSREAKLVGARRKLEQAAIKLSLFLRTDAGAPFLIDAQRLPAEFPVPSETADDHSLGSNQTSELLTDDVELALAQRPELSELQIIRQQINIAMRQACNEMRPDIDAGVLVGQDVGAPTSSKRDKSELELEALITLSVPLERRKARGKIRSLQGKLASISAKTRFTSDKIVADVRIARVALTAAGERVTKATESYSLADQMLEAERELFSVGQSTLFELNAREKQTAEAAVQRISAFFEYHVAKADYAAAMGFGAPLAEPVTPESVKEPLS
ncbi:TolC family protein [Adhaeretor mobilis]|uniref:TolC family protein n=1 Tax=Adhaeretor mobilis TaxID=1930276 RepID=UPI001C54CB0C|nr:TolC family protein [Adhaeretor mobilis]